MFFGWVLFFSVHRVVQARLGAAFMGKQGRQKFADVWADQTTLGKQFGLSPIAMGKKRIGLLASNAALAEYFVTALGIADHAVMLYPRGRILSRRSPALPRCKGERHTRSCSAS